MMVTDFLNGDGHVVQLDSSSIQEHGLRLKFCDECYKLNSLSIDSLFSKYPKDIFGKISVNLGIPFNTLVSLIIVFIISGLCAFVSGIILALVFGG